MGLRMLKKWKSVFAAGLFLLIMGAGRTSAQSGPQIGQVTNNASVYLESKVPVYEKFELTFGVGNVSGKRMNWPYDSNPPHGIAAGEGITVDALFTPDNWQTIYKQPAFYYESFLDETRGNSEWFYPTNNFSWKVRFSPDRAGTWRYKIVAEDVGGRTESGEATFEVVPGDGHGFVKVSEKDNRYFEFDDGTFFPGLGYNMNYDHVQWTNPILGNQDNFVEMKNNNIQLIRIWLSEWSIFGSAWNPWYGIRNDYDNYVPRNGMITFGLPASEETPASQLVLVYAESNGVQNSGSWFDACRVAGGFQARSAVKRNTKYQISIRYRAINLVGPRIEDKVSFPNGDNFGLVAKVQNPADGNWYNTDHPNDFYCWNYSSNNADTGVRVTSYGGNTLGWETLTGEWNSENNDFLPPFYLVLENVRPGDHANGVANPYVYIDKVEIKDPDGINIVTKPSMEQLFYFMERNAYAFDKVLELAHKNEVYLRPVILEKNEQTENEIGPDGARTAFNNNNFYGEWETITPIRWLQMTWWRYLQARWGYSPNIHSWELLNEGDPSNSRHSSMANELAKYMHQFGPNSHLVSTSNWSSYPSSFWSGCPECDFTDYHRYVDKATNSSLFYDSAKATFESSKAVYATKLNNNINKPIIRGETGFTDSGTEPGTMDLTCQDSEGWWLHNFLWGGVNSFGVIESYWYENEHIYPSGRFDCDNNSSTPRETINRDFRSQYKPIYQFLMSISPNKGGFEDAGAVSSNQQLLAWGQKNLTSKQAYLWVANANSTWRNVVEGRVGSAQSGDVAISGFEPGGTYILNWWNTWDGSIAKTETKVADDRGVLDFQVTNLMSDTAVIIKPEEVTPQNRPGDANGDNEVDGIDYVIWLNNFGLRVENGSLGGDFNNDKNTDGIDYVIWLNNFGS